MIVLIPYINLSNLSRIKKMYIFEEYGTFKKKTVATIYFEKLCKRLENYREMDTQVIDFLYI